MCGNVEPIGLAIADRAGVWSRASGISRRGFAAGYDIEILWNERFSRLTEFSTQIIIIDAYALHARQFSGFLKLLQLIDRDGHSCRVTLFSAPPTDSDVAVKGIQEQLSEEVARLSGVGVQQITVRLLPISEQEHDRRIRFDRSVFAPENSIALVFSGNDGAVPEDVGCTFILSDDAYHPYNVMKETENELIKKASRLKWLATEQDYLVLYPDGQ